MNKRYEERRKCVEDFYQDHELLLIGMNDYANSSVVFNSLLKLIEKEINSTVLTVDAGSLTLNKSEHIDITLGYNLTVEEVKIAKLISIYDGVLNFIKERFGKEKAKKIEQSSLNKLLNPSLVRTSELDKVGISDLIRGTSMPLIIHSTGANNLMRVLGTNPYVLEHDYKTRNTNLQFYYSLGKASSDKTVHMVIDGVKSNFENIYTLNPNSRIFSLGLYMPKIFRKERYKEFRELILRYNEALEKLCAEYDVSYIETINKGNTHPNHLIDFNLSLRAQKEIAKMIVQELFIYLDVVRFEPEYKEIKPIKYENKENLVSAYKKMAATKDIFVYENGNTYLDDLQEIKLLNERNREVKIYAKTFKEVKRRNEKCV